MKKTISLIFLFLMLSLVFIACSKKEISPAQPEKIVAQNEVSPGSNPVQKTETAKIPADIESTEALDNAEKNLDDVD